MTTRYSQGRDAEYRAIDELQAEGYDAARAAGSHGPADVIAWNSKLIRYIQVKTFRSKKPPSYAEDQAKLEELVVPPNASKELWVRRVGQRGWWLQLVIAAPQEQPA